MKKRIIVEYIINELLSRTRDQRSSHSRDKVRVILDLSNYATKNN